MPTILTPTDLNKIISDAIQFATTYAPYSIPALDQLAASGLRVNEVLELERWKPVPATFAFTVELEKESGSRIISGAYLATSYATYLTDNPRRPLPVTARQINYIIKNSMTYSAIFRGAKEIKSAVFRYSLIRNLYASGYTAEQIQAIICHSNLQTTLAYIHAPITAI